MSRTMSRLRRPPVPTIEAHFGEISPECFPPAFGQQTLKIGLRRLKDALAHFDENEDEDVIVRALMDVSYIREVCEKRPYWLQEDNGDMIAALHHKVITQIRAGHPFYQEQALRKISQDLGVILEIAILNLPRPLSTNLAYQAVHLYAMAKSDSPAIRREKYGDAAENPGRILTMALKKTPPECIKAATYFLLADIFKRMNDLPQEDSAQLRKKRQCRLYANVSALALIAANAPSVVDSKIIPFTHQGKNWVDLVAVLTEAAKDPFDLALPRISLNNLVQLLTDKDSWDSLGRIEKGHHPLQLSR